MAVFFGFFGHSQKHKPSWAREKWRVRAKVVFRPSSGRSSLSLTPKISRGRQGGAPARKFFFRERYATLQQMSWQAHGSSFVLGGISGSAPAGSAVDDQQPDTQLLSVFSFSRVIGSRAQGGRGGKRRERHYGNSGCRVFPVELVPSQCEVRTLFFLLVHRFEVLCSKLPILVYIAILHN